MRRVTDRHTDDPRLLLFCVEFIRRYQLAVQQKYYRERSTSHRASFRKTVIIGAAAAAVLAVASDGFGIGAAFFEPNVLALAALGTIGAALATVASRREELNQDERNTERYRCTYEILSRIRERHSDVQNAVARGEAKILLQYIAAIHEQLSPEHRQWLVDTEAMDSTIRELNASLGTHGD